MTTFAYATSVAPNLEFSTDSYPDFLSTTSQPCTTTDSYSTSSFDPLTSYPSLSLPAVYSDVSNPSEPPYLSLSRSDSVSYSPVHSPGEHLVPRLSASSESGASVQSTSSSTMASPYLHAQNYASPLYSAVNTSGMSFESNEMTQPQEIFFTAPDGSKMSGYVGESKSPISAFQSGSRFPIANASVRSVVPLSPSRQSAPSGSPKTPSSAQVRSPPPAVWHPVSVAKSHDEPIFKSPGLPASARFSPSAYASAIPQSFEYNHSRRNSLLSNQIYPEPDSPARVILPSISDQFPHSELVSSTSSDTTSFHSCSFPFPLFGGFVLS
jgi:hypothetical protein